MNNGTIIFFMIIFLICSGLSIAAFSRINNKSCSEGFDKKLSSGQCKKEYKKAVRNCKRKNKKNKKKQIECINKHAQKLINNKGCPDCADSMKMCMKENKDKADPESHCIHKSLKKGCIRKIPCINA